MQVQKCGIIAASPPPSHTSSDLSEKSKIVLFLAIDRALAIVPKISWVTTFIRKKQ